jgi:protein-disulfide isomerase-like protein with CxxC motif
MEIRVKAIIVAGCLSLLTGCAGLPEGTRSQADADAGLILIHRDKFVRLYARPGFNPTRFGAFALNHVEVQTPPSLAAEQKAEQEQLGTDLTVQLMGLFGTRESASRLHVDIRLRDIKSVSPVLNALTIVLAFVPLDTGAMIVDTTYRNDLGIIQAHRIEQLTGSVFNIKASFSAYGQHKLMLSEWAQRCAMSAACLAEGIEQRREPVALR